MNPQTRLLMVYAVRLAFLFFAGWIAFVEDALPGASMVARLGLVALFLVFSILIGEVARLHAQFDIFLKAIRAAGVKVQPDAPVRDDREAVPILIRALGSRDADTREKAHRNLVRLTGQALPPDRDAWQAWWKDASQGASERE